MSLSAAEIAFAALLLFSLFLSDSVFIEADLLPKRYGFIAGAMMFVSIIVFSAKTVVIKTDGIFISVLIFCGYILIRNCIAGTQAVNILEIIWFTALYNSLKIGGENKKIDFGKIIVFCTVLQAMYGISQYIGIFRSHTDLGITGGFDNPAGFAACLVCAFPFCLAALKKSTFWKYAGTAAIIIILTALCLSRSRAGIIAVIAILLVYFGTTYKTFFRKHIKLTFVASVLIVFLMFFLVLLKKDSALGRIAIWNNTVQMIADKPLTGFGPGGFLSEYMEYQGRYFADNPDSEFAILADNVTSPFNEYLSLTVEYGLIGAALLILLIILIVKNGKPDSPYFLCLLSIAVFSCFSYPLRYPSVWILIAYSLSAIETASAKKTVIKKTFYIKTIYTFVLTASLYFLYRDIRFEYKWGELVKKAPIVKKAELIKNYADLYDQNNGSPLFLYNYAAILNKNKEFGLSNLIISECEKYLNDYDVQMILANNYMNTGNLELAEEHYYKAHYMAPNRFMPLNFLMEIYILQDDIGKAFETAETIVDKEVKIPSDHVSEIINKAQDFINNNLNN